MANDPSFKGWIVDEERYLRFYSEIGYYAGKVRNDANLLRLVAERHEQCFADAVAENNGVNLADFDSLVLPTEKRADDLDILEYEVGSAPIEKNRKDQELEAEDFDDEDDGSATLVRKAPTDALDRLTTSLILYSSLVKNLELISDEEKRAALGPIWVGWATILMVALRSAPKLAKLRRVRIGSALCEVQAPQGMSDNVLLRKMMLLLPHIHINLLSAAVGTEKLDRQLSEPRLEDIGEPKIVKLLRTGVISELRLDATPGSFSQLAAELSGNMYLLWSLIVHMGELRRLDRIREEHYKSIMSPLAGAIADLRGGNVKKKALAKRNSLAQLQRDALLLTMKKKKERGTSS